MMKLILALMALGSASLGGVATAAPAVRFVLPAEPMILVTNEDAFRPWADKVRVEVERMFGEPAAIDDPATLKILLSTRVHLAHHYAENDKAVSTAAWIRSLQTDPAGRAFAGLTTLASVEARRRHPGAAPSDQRYQATFFREFARQLAELPHTPGIVVMLQGQREKIAGITEEALLAETREVIIPAIEQQGYCGLLEADQLVRVRHRLVSILPVRQETLRALDAAIEARDSRATR
jgi:hypothetical protein